MEQMINLYDLLEHKINHLYSAEEQIIAALPAMIEKAANLKLKALLEEHLTVTRVQKDRLEQVKQILSSGVQEKKPGFLEQIFGDTQCTGTEGLIKEAAHMMKQNMAPEVMDAAIIAAAQKIEHYEISGYGTARAYAMQLGLSTVESLLKQTLDEEYLADDNLSELAYLDVNLEAEGQASIHKRRG